MRRADRLFQLVQLLRTRKLITAAALAAELEVSARTVYRDVADLMASGVPIEGEAGVGYALPHGFDLPPLMFDAEEIGALVLGARMVQAFGDEALAARAKTLLAKVEAVVPERLRKGFGRPEWQVWPSMRREVRAHVERLRRAIDGRRKLRFRYLDQQGAETVRTVRPLCLAFWGTVWTAGTWCELRQGFRNFRPDRMREVELLEPFADEPGKDLAAYLRTVEEDLTRERAGGARGAACRRPSRAAERVSKNPAPLWRGCSCSPSNPLGASSSRPQDLEARRGWIVAHTLST